MHEVVQGDTVSPMYCYCKVGTVLVHDENCNAKVGSFSHNSQRATFNNETKTTSLATFSLKTKNKMTIEATLSRSFGMTFIDARALATEAKLNLGITSYPTKEQKEQLIIEASRLYEQQSENTRKTYQQRRMSLESAKSCSSEFSEGGSVDCDASVGGSSVNSTSSRGFVAAILSKRAVKAIRGK